MTPSHPRQKDLLDVLPKTYNERRLQTALENAEQRAEKWKTRFAHAQASNVLNEMYCTKLQFQLQHAEEKKAKGKGKGKLVGDGLPLLLSGDEFYEKVVEFTQWQKEEALAKAMRARKKAELAGPIFFFLLGRKTMR
jgi:hypothetical protein